MDDSNTLSQEIKYRPTPQREAILRVLLQADNHMSAEDIYRQVRTELSGINFSTVYRWLKSLKSMGQVSAVDFGEHRVFYKHISNISHTHLVCHKCGRIIDANGDLFDSLKKDLIERYRFTAEIKNMVVLGECIRCENEATQDSTGNPPSCQDYPP